MRLAYLTLLVVIVLVGGIVAPAAAQDSVYPLPAPLYLLDSQHTLLRVDPVTGEQVAISSPAQPVADFDIAPDGEWYVYRNLDSAIIVTDLTTGSGYVLEFDVPAPPSSDAQTIAWSPDASRLAYITPDGLRIANLGAGQYGDARFSDVPGAWVELYWLDGSTLIASDDQGSATRISPDPDASDQWLTEAASDLPASAEPGVASHLTPDGVVLDDDTLIPATAGVLAYDWGPVPPAVVETLDLPADLFYTMADDNGKLQVWQLRSGELPYQWTADPEGVIAFALSPIHSQIAYATPTRLVVADSEGGQTVATLETKNGGASLGWSPEGSQVAYQDVRGLWIAPADGAYAARLVREHKIPDPNSNEITSVEVYRDPRWSPDGSQLLVTIGLWEGSQQGLINTATGELTPVNAINIGRARWTRAGQIIGWSGFWGYESPGLFLADPAEPDGPAIELLDPETPVLDVFQALDGSVAIVRPNSAQQGPPFVRAQSAASFGEPFMPPMTDAPGGYISRPQIYATGLAPEDATGSVAESAPGGMIIVAGLRHMTYDDQGVAAGDLVILDLSPAQGGGVVMPVQLQTPRPISNVQWGR